VDPSTLHDNLSLFSNLRPHEVDYTWNPGDVPLTLAPASTHICGLTGVRGKFASADDRVSVDVDSNGYWVLWGPTSPSSVSARASCVNLSAFITPAGVQSSNATWTQDFRSYVTDKTCYSNDNPPDDAFDPPDYLKDINLDQPDIDPNAQTGGPFPYHCRAYAADVETGWGTDAVCFLTAFGGYHLSDPQRQSGEGATASLAPSRYGVVNPLWVLDTFAGDLGQISTGGAACLRFPGIPTTSTNWQSGAYPLIGTVESTVGMPVVYVAAADALGYSSPPLAKRDDAFCVLSELRGSFMSTNESVSIDVIDSAGHQALSANAGPWIWGPTVYATCIYYNQVAPPDPTVEPFQ
jgi:hypothetical protein